MYKLVFINFLCTSEKNHATLEEAIREAVKGTFECNIVRSGERIVGPSQSDVVIGHYSFFDGYKSLEQVN